MAYQGIGTGTTPNDNTGDSLFTGAVKINSNFSEIYNALGDGSNINLSKSRTITAGSGLSGGGNLSADITLNIGQGDGISVSTDTVAVDSTVIRTSGGQTIAGTLNVNGGSVTGGDALVIQNGGDLRLYNSANAGSTFLYCNTNEVLNVGTKLVVDESITSGIFYDISNLSYYLNPASTSSLNSINLNGTLSLNIGSVTSGDALAIQNGGDLRLYNSGNAGSSRLYCDTNGVINVDGNITTGVFNSTVSTGTAPFTVSSTTKVTNLNVDFLDGIDSSRVVYGDSETKTTDNNNWNAALSSGFYNQFGPSGAGTPTETWYHMICCRHPNSSNNYQMQISGELFDVNNLYYRIINNNTPTSWYKIWHSNNHGPESGLDADLLDGLQSSSANTPSTIVARDGSGNFSAGTVTATTFSGNGTIPINGIIMWNGTIAEAIALEPGWALCDGRSVNGKTTPDLRERFIVGAGGANTTNPVDGGQNPGGYNVGEFEGSANAIVVSHSHTGSTSDPGGHIHSINYQSKQVADPVSSAFFEYASDLSYRDGGGVVVGSEDLTSTWVANDPNRGPIINAAGNHTHTVTVNSTGDSGTNKNLPPYYALAFIMRVA